MDDIETDCLSFWHKSHTSLDKLYLPAMRAFSVPASSAAVERVFSQGGLIMRPHRVRLCDKVVSQLIFLRCNTDSSDWSLSVVQQHFVTDLCSRQQFSFWFVSLHDNTILRHLCSSNLYVIAKTRYLYLYLRLGYLYSYLYLRVLVLVTSLHCMLTYYPGNG